MATKNDSNFRTKNLDEALGRAMDWASLYAKLTGALALISSSERTEECEGLCSARTLIQDAITEYKAMVGFMDEATLHRSAELSSCAAVGGH